MRALSKTVVDAIWVAIEPLLPRAPDRHPLGCHRPRVCDRLCFRGVIIGLVTGCSWETVEMILDGAVSDTTLRSRRDEWAAAGVFDQIADEAIAAWDRIVGLRLPDVCVDGSTHKAARRGLHHDIETLHLDRGCLGARVDTAAAHLDITDIVRPSKRRPATGPRAKAKNAPLALRWTVERTNSWLSNFGQLRRNTDRRPEHRTAQLALAAALIITAKLIDHRNRWQPQQPPIR